MTQTQPKFNILFRELAVSAIQRSAKGIVALILDDTVMSENVLTLRTFADLKTSDVDAKNYELIQLCFMGNPNKVIVVKKQAEISDTVAILGKLRFNYYAMPSAESADITALKSYYDARRAKLTAFAKGVFANALAPDSQRIINFAQEEDMTLNFTGTAKTYTAGEYTVRIAGILAGIPDTMSATYYKLSEIVDMKVSEDPDADAGLGKLVVLSENGIFKLGRAINSLTTLTDGVTKAFQKIKIVSAIDLITEDIVTTYRDAYVGKYNNFYGNKLRFVGAVNSYLKGLEGTLLDPSMKNKVDVSIEKNKKYLEDQGKDTSKMSDEQLKQADTGSEVLLDGHASPVDAMEDLTLDILMYQEVKEV